MKKILFIILLITSFANAQSSFKDAEHEFVPACNNGKSIVMARFWFHINAIDTVWKVYYFDSTGKSYTPTGAVTLGFCFKPDTGALAMFQSIIDTLSSINSKEALNNQKNDTIIKRLDSLNAKTYFDSSWYKNLRAIELNLKDSLRTFRYSYLDTTNARLLNLVNKTYFDSSWYSMLRALQINVKDSLRTFNYRYDSINNVQNDSILARLSATKDTILPLVHSKYQVADCNGTNIGTPQDVLKTIILNNVTTRICNTADFKDTSSLEFLRAIKINLADSLRTFRYQYIDTTNARISRLLEKQFADTTINGVIRKLQINVQDSLRTYNVAFDTSNARLLRLLSTKYFDTTINEIVRKIQINIADSLRTFQYSYIDTTNARLAQLLLKQFADTSINPSIRAIQKNIADSLRTFNYSYLDTSNFYLKQLANKSTDSTLIKASATFQVKDCDGNNIGTPENVLKTTVLNKITASICNLSDIKGDTSANAILRAIKTNLADSLRTFNYSYLDTVNSKLSSLLTKNFVDTSINSSIRAIQKNIADSLRTYNYKYDSINIVRNDSIISKLSGLKSDSVSIDKYGTLYQVKNCQDSSIGTPEKAIKVIQLNKSTVSICNVSELADSIGSKISGGTTPVTKPLLKNISGTTFNSISTCEKLNLNCCWTGTIVITDAFGNSTTLTDGSGFNFDSYKGKMQGITINATGATGAFISGVCE